MKLYLLPSGVDIALLSIGQAHQVHRGRLSLLIGAVGAASKVRPIDKAEARSACV